jgi:cytosol alanyl aminopeptidase
MAGVTRLIALSLLTFCLASVTAIAQNAPPKLRLPLTVHPVRYSADLRITPGEERFDGSIAIDLEISQPLSVFWIHARSLKFEETTLRIAGHDIPAQAVAAQNVEGDFIATTTATPLPAGHATLHITYTGEVSRTLTDGAFQQQAGSDWYVFTKFEPVTARRVFPCFDEPSFKVPWQLTLHVPKDLKAFSNTAIASEKDEPNGTKEIPYKEVRFNETKPLPSYLIAFAAGPFDVVGTAPVGSNRRPSRIIVPRGRASEAAYAASITPKLIELLEDYFGTPYPYEKLDQIVVPLTTAWGAMENAGLIAYGDFLLSPKEQDTGLLQRRRAETMEHEMSHQWFGDLVTMDWWDDIWLNEAFASWVSSKLLNEWKPEWNIKADAAASSSVTRSDSLTTARKIRQPIEAPGDIANAFDGITYGKGQAVIGMFENYMGPKTFQRAIRTYLQQHAWGNATSADLLAALDSASGNKVGAAFSTFLNQVGFPVISVKLSCESHPPTVELEQHRFLPLGSPGESKAVWYVPVCTSWGDGAGTHRQCNLLTKSADRFELKDANAAKACPAWLFADSNAAGYYAVSYDAELAQKLISQGLPNLQRDESAAALRNIQLMFSAGVGDTQQQLTFVAEFSHNSDAGLVRQAAVTVESISDLVPADLSPNYAQLIRALYGTRAHQLGWKPQLDESQEVRQLRIEIVPLVATHGEDPDLSSQAAALAHEWLKNHQSLDPDMVEPVLSAAAWKGDRALFDQFVDEIKKNKIQRERSWMIGALDSFRDPAITHARLELILGGGIDPREMRNTLFNAPAYAREIVWQYIQTDFNALNSALPGARGIPFGASLPLAATGFCDEERRWQVESFFQRRMATLPGGARYLAIALERIRLCGARATGIKPVIISFLNSYNQ